MAPLTSNSGQCSLTNEECPHEQQLQFITKIMPLLVSAGIAIGAGTYYFMSGRIENKEKALHKNTELLLKFLNEDERKIVDKLIEGKGKIVQAEITRLPGMNKVKVHRTVQRLIDRNVIESERLGKTNQLKFNKEIMEGLF